MQELERHCGVFSTSKDQKRLFVFLPRALRAFLRSGVDENDGAQIVFADTGSDSERRRQERFEWITRLVTISGRWRPDVSGHTLREYIDPLAAQMRVALTWKLEMPKCGGDAHARRPSR